MLRLGDVVARGIAIDDDVRRVVGAPADFAPDAPFWCLVRGGSVVSVAETIAGFARHVAVQQVFTAAAWRGQGCAHDLLRCALRGHPVGTTFVWITSPANAGSLRLARKLGFRPAGEVGCVSASS